MCIAQVVLGDESNNPYIWAVTYYDNHGREVQCSRRNPMGGWDKTNTGYGYTGQPLISRTVHFDGMFNAFAERYTYSYDAWDRLLTVTHGISANGALQSGEYSYGTTSQLHAYVYDFAGRMVSDNRNTVNALKSSYAYNVRGWTERIAVGWNASNASYGSTFVEALRYQASQSPSQNPVQWGGNISSMDWKCGNDNVLRTYDFSYDGLSRLQSAVYRDGQNNNGNYNRTYTYDLHGNMLSLTTPSVTVTATYTGNRRAGSYTYDSNGNQTSDPDAGLTGMTYNALNLLSGYTDSATGKQTSLSYTASGEKFGVSTVDGQITSNHWNRFGNVVYDNSFSPTHLLVDGGYVDLTGALGNATYAYRFYVQDHQGNNRMVTDANGTVLQVNHYDPYGQLLTPISSTTAVSQYKYGGKEWSGTTLSYDFGARYYLPALPRWSAMDPLAEKYYSVSPYVYCAGNPVNLVDSSGKMVIPWYFLVKCTGVVMESQGKSNIIKTVGYEIQHPDKALMIGFPKAPIPSISQTASNFSINLGNHIGMTSNEPGSGKNAMRHTIWQGLITTRFGLLHALRVGRAHEDRKVDLSARVFYNIEDADTVADFLNNSIGQAAGAVPHQTAIEIVKTILDVFKTEGLWMVTNVGDGSFSIDRKTITEEEYQAELDYLEQLKKNGKQKN